MSRFFDGQFSTESVSFSAGNATFDQGPITMAALVRATGSTTQYVVTGQNSGTDVWSLIIDANQPYMNNDFGTGGPTLTSGEWYWVVGTKAAGSTLPRWHVKNVTTGAAWVHSNSSANVADGTGPVNGIIVGNATAAGGTDLRGELAAVAVWGSALADLAVEAACTLSAADLSAAAPAWGTLWNQASTATPVTDFTGGGGNQTAISGTTVDADEPPGWSYSLTAASSSYAGPWTGPTPGRIGPTGRWRPQPPGNAKPALVVAIGAAAETDSAVAVGRTKAKTIGAAASTDTAIPAGRAKARALGIATGTDTALALARTKAKTLGVASETDTAVAFGRVKARAVGMAGETDTAVAITAPVATRHNLCPNPACGTNTTGWSSNSTFARTATITGMPVSTGAVFTGVGFLQTPTGAAASGDVLTVSLYVKNNTATDLTGVSRSIIVGYTRSAGGDTFPESFSVDYGTVGTTQRVSFTCAAAPANATGIYLVVDSLNITAWGGTGIEVSAVLYELSPALGSYFDGDTSGARWDGTPDNSTSTFGPLSAVVGTASETDSAMPISAALVAAPSYAGPWTGMTPGWRSPTGQLSVFFGSATVANITTATLGVAAETDQAQLIGRSKTKAVGAAAGTDTALPAATRKARTIGTATATDSALTVGRTHTRTIGIAATTDTAVTAGRAKRRLIGQASTTSTALSISTPGHLFGAVATATETDQALTLGRVKTRTVGVATTTSAALAMGRRKSRAVGVTAMADTPGALQNPVSLAVGGAVEVDSAGHLRRARRYVVRPFTGYVTRPSIGLVTRPFDGYVTRP